MTRELGLLKSAKADYFRTQLISEHVHHKTSTNAISAANRQSGGQDGCFREKFRNFVTWAEPDPRKQHFRVLGYPSTVLRTAYRKQFYPNQWYQWKAETLDSFASLESL